MMRHVLAAICAAFLVFAAPAQGLAEDFLSKNDRRLVQQSLTQSGYNTRGVDGVFGKGTRRAIRDWQATNGYRSTGRLTEAQFNAIIGSSRASLPLGHQPTTAAVDAVPSVRCRRCRQTLAVVARRQRHLRRLADEYNGRRDDVVVAYTQNDGYRHA